MKNPELMKQFENMMKAMLDGGATNQQNLETDGQGVL